MPLVDWSFVALADLTAWDLDITTYPDELTALTNNIVSFMEEYTGRKLKARDYSYLVPADKVDAIGDGDGACYFFTSQYPINTITTLYIGDNLIAAAPDWDDDSGYKFYNDQGKIYYAYGFDKYRQNILLVYNAGYADGTPEYSELNMIQCALTAYIFNHRDKLGFKQEFLGRYRYTRGTFKDADSWIFESLDRYRRKVLK